MADALACTAAKVANIREKKLSLQGSTAGGLAQSDAPQDASRTENRAVKIIVHGLRFI
jgi:hypothetical protein